MKLIIKKDKVIDRTYHYYYLFISDDRYYILTDPIDSDPESNLITISNSTYESLITDINLYPNLYKNYEIVTKLTKDQMRFIIKAFLSYRLA